jgi:hypothetical protein
VAVRDQLTRHGAGPREAASVDRAVEPALEQLQESVAGHLRPSARHLEEAAELALAHTIDALHLLLLAQLSGEVRRAPTTERATVIAGNLPNAALQALSACAEEVSALAT